MSKAGLEINSQQFFLVILKNSDANLLVLLQASALRHPPCPLRSPPHFFSPIHLLYWQSGTCTVFTVLNILFASKSSVQLGTSRRKY